MRLLTISLLLLTSVVMFTTRTFAQDQYVSVTSSFVNVYKDLDPKSPVVGTAHKGQYLPLLSIGDAWYKVKYRDSEGWLEKRAGDVVNKAKGSPTGIIIVLLALVAIVASGVAFFIYKSKISETT